MTTDFDTLISHLSDLLTSQQLKFNQIDQSTQTRHNQLTSLPKPASIQGLPPKLFLKICSYLDFTSDIPNLIETCKSFQSSLLTPSLLSLKHKTLLKGKQIFLNPETEEAKEETSQNDENKFIDKRDAILELKKTSAVCKFLENKTQNQDKGIEDKAKEVDGLKNKLRIEKNIWNKVAGKITKVQNFYESVRDERGKCEKNYFEVLDLEDKELERLAQVQNRLRTEIDDLRNRVRVLGFEKGKMEREVVERECELRRFRDAVCKLKDFYFLMFESKVSELIRSFE